MFVGGEWRGRRCREMCVCTCTSSMQTVGVVDMGVMALCDVSIGIGLGYLEIKSAYCVILE